MLAYLLLLICHKVSSSGSALLAEIKIGKILHFAFP